MMRCSRRVAMVSGAAMLGQGVLGELWRVIDGLGAGRGIDRRLELDAQERAHELLTVWAQTTVELQRLLPQCQLDNDALVRSKAAPAAADCLGRELAKALEVRTP